MLMRFTTVAACFLLAIQAFAQHEDMFVWTENGQPIRQGKHIEWFRSGFPSDSGSVMYTWSDTRNGDRDVFAQKIDRGGNKLWGEAGTNVIEFNDRQEDPVLVTDGAGGAIIFWVDFRADSTGDILAQRIDSLGNKVWDPAGVEIAVAPKTQISIRMAEDDNGGAFGAWLDNRNGGSTDLYGIHINGDGTINAGWAAGGNPVSLAGSDQFQHSLDKDGTGNAILVWSDTRQGAGPDIYAQRLMQDGSMNWLEDGMVVSDAADAQWTPKLVYTGSSGVFVTWRDLSEDAKGNIVGQRLDPDGTLGWGAGGINICSLENKQVNPRVTAYDDDFFITWEDFRNDPVVTDIYAQKISYDGTTQWTVDGVSVTSATGDQVQPRLTPDEQGGTYIVWTDYRNGGFPENDIYLQHIASDGTAQFTTDGEAVVNAPYAQDRPLIRPDGEHGAIIAWGDARTGSVAIYIQRIQLDGTHLWNQNGDNLYSGIDGDARHPRIVNGSNNALITFWEDHRKGAIGSHIYVQETNETGEPLRDVNGTPLASIDSLRQFLPVIVAGSSGGEQFYYVAWEDVTSEREVRLQRLTSDFTPQWDEVGVSVENAISESSRPSVVVTPDGDAIIGWSDIRSLFSNEVYAQKYNSAGEPQWVEDGQLVGDLSGDNLLEGMYAVDEGVYLVWQGGNFEDLNIFVQMIDYSGAPVSGWEDGPFAVVEASTHQTNPVLIPGDDSGNMYVLWEDKRNGNSDIYMNEVTPSGVSVTDGFEVFGGPADQNDPAAALYNGGLFVACQDFSNGTDFNLIYQKVDTSDWSMDPEPHFLVESAGNQSSVFVERLADGTLLTAWSDDRNGVDTDIFAQWLDANANWHLWNDGGVIICDAIQKQIEPQILAHPEEGAYIVWDDNRSSGKTELFNLYGARLSALSSGTEEPGEVVPLGFAVEQNYPNPFNPTTTIPYTIDSPGKVAFAIFNLRGQQIWKSTRAHSGSGRYEIRWNGTTSSGQNVASGTYFLRATHQQQVVTRKLLIIE